jgi:hypothetical protein
VNFDLDNGARAGGARGEVDAAVVLWRAELVHGARPEEAQDHGGALKSAEHDRDAAVLADVRDGFAPCSHVVNMIVADK